MNINSSYTNTRLSTSGGILDVARVSLTSSYSDLYRQRLLLAMVFSLTQASSIRFFPLVLTVFYLLLLACSYERTRINASGSIAVPRLTDWKRETTTVDAFLLPRTICFVEKKTLRNMQS